MFHPPHCVQPGCINENSILGTPWCTPIPAYWTKTFGWVPRWRCNACGKTFSRQTFSIHYYAKKKLDLPYIYNQINAGAGIRNIARDLNVKADVITNRIRRLARNAIIAHLKIVDQLTFHEDLAADGFESFCVSQYFPDNYTLLVGSDSQFVYACDYATIRRKGRMTRLQKLRRMKLEVCFRASPKSLEHSFMRICDLLQRWIPDRDDNSLNIFTDEKKDYQRALWNHHQYDQQLFGGTWRHLRINSKEPRTRWNPLFPVNYIDREIRKDMAAHARESVQWSRNVNNAMHRMYLYLYDHNVRKPYRIQYGVDEDERHATVAGISKVRLDQLTDGFFSKRFFRDRPYNIETPFMKSLMMWWRTPLKAKKDYRPMYMVA